MNNAVYGKMMENLRNRVNVRPASNENGYQSQAICHKKYLTMI